MPSNQPEQITAFCYAEGSGAQWEAFCLNFDLAVEGKSFQDVYDRLNDQISLYIEDVFSMPEAERSRFLRRAMPWQIWFKVLAKTVNMLFRRRMTKLVHEYSVSILDGIVSA